MQPWQVVPCLTCHTSIAGALARSWRCNSRAAEWCLEATHIPPPPSPDPPRTRPTHLHGGVRFKQQRAQAQTLTDTLSSNVLKLKP